MAEKKFFVDINLQASDITNLKADTLDITSNLASANTKRIAYWSGQYYYSNGTSWIALGATGTLPVGGVTGDILAKASGTDYDVEWISNYTSTVQHEVKLAENISKGQAAYVSSANGTNMLVSKASNATEATSSKTMGLIASTGVTNDIVFLITEGLLAGLDTSTATAGDPVWLGTNGNLIYGLINKPVAPAHLVFIGIVTRAQSNNGEIFVKVQNGFELGELHNVDALNASNNDGLFYNTTTSLWEHKSIATALGYTPENVANKSTDVSLGTSDTLYPTQNAVKVYTDNILGNSNALVYKGTIDCSTNPDYPTADAGWMYIASVAGKIGGASGTDVEVGDMIICNTDGTVSGNQATVGQYWNVIQKNIVGAVTGPASSVNNTVAVFDGTTGKVIKQGIITDTGTNVGIGTDTPTTKLEVNGTYKFGEAGGILFSGSNSGTNLDMTALNNSGWTGSHKISTSDSNGTVFFGTYGSNTSLISSHWTVGTSSSVNGYDLTTGIHLLKNGNVGIGTATPTQKLSVSGGSVTADNYYINGATYAQVPYRYVKQVSGLVSGTWTNICNVLGDSLSSGVSISIMGTAASTVVNVVADILVNHYQDIFIESKAGAYTILTLRVISDDNQNFTIQATTNSVNSITASVEVYPLNNESVIFDSITPYSGMLLQHDCVPGLSISGNDGGTSDISNITTKGAVGIGILGINNPTAKLHINNTGDGNSFLVEDDSNVDNTPFIIDELGRVGIGTINPDAKLQVDGDVYINGSHYIYHPVNSTSGYLNLDHAGVRMWKIGIFNDNTSTFSIGNGAGNTFGDRVFNLTTGGNLGLGTNTPTAKLQVLKGSQSDTITIENSAAWIAGLDVGLAIGQLESAPYGNWIQSLRPDNATFPLLLNPSGSNVGIGVTNPIATLHVRTTAVPSNGEAIAQFDVSDDSSYLKISNSTGANNTFIPSLESYNSSNQTALYTLGNGATDTGAEPLLTFDARIGAAQVATRPLFQWTNYGNVKMTMSANGNLGIGTTTPNSKLEVNGDVKVSTIANATTDTDKFLVSDSGVIKYRTGAEVLSDLGAQGSLTVTTTGTNGAATFVGNTLNIPVYESSLIPKMSGNEIWRGSTFRNNITTIDTTSGIVLSTTGTNTARSVGTTSYAARGIRLGVAATTASVGRYQGMRGSALLWYVTGGFLYTGEFNISDTAFVTGTHNFWGLASSTSDLLIGGSNNDQPSALTNIIAFANDSGDANLQIMHNDASGTATKTDLGSSFPSNRTAGAAITTIYSCYLYNAPNSSDVIYRIVNKETGAVAQGTLSTNLPASTVGLNFFGARTMGTQLGGINNSGQFDVYRLGVYSL
jgi:hypothetical protein